MSSKRITMLGVTLLEVMLVLAVAATIIVMSVRYYRTATAGRQANEALVMIQSMTALADRLAQGSNSYASIDLTTKIPKLMPNQNMTSPWGSQVTIRAMSSDKIRIILPATPEAVCIQLDQMLTANKAYVSSTTCPAAVNDVTVFYSRQI